MISALKALRKMAKYAGLTGKEALATLKIAGIPRGFMTLFCRPVRRHDNSGDNSGDCAV